MWKEVNIVSTISAQALVSLIFFHTTNNNTRCVFISGMEKKFMNQALVDFSAIHTPSATLMKGKR